MTGQHPEPGSDLTCVELAELVTAYLDGALPPQLTEQVDAHLPGCAGCRTTLAQWRTVIDLAGHLTEDDINRADPLARDQLTATFRRARRR